MPSQSSRSRGKRGEERDLRNEDTGYELELPLGYLREPLRRCCLLYSPSVRELQETRIILV